MTNSRACAKCKQLLPVTSFGPDKARKDGLRNQCRKCRAAQARIYRKNNPEAYKQANIKYFEKNPQKRKELWQSYYQTHKTELLQKQKLKRKNNPEVYRQKDAIHREKHKDKRKQQGYLRRMRMSQNGIFKVTNKEISKLLASPCYYCESTDEIQIDHLLPISKGGRHSIGNLVPACRLCNMSKNNKFYFQWIKGL